MHGFHAPAPAPLVGRERELRRLLDRLHRGQVVLVCGDAGIGKTALVRAAARTDPERILYVAEARTCALAAAGIAAAVSSTPADHRRATLTLLRAGRAARASVITRRLGGDIRAVVLDHIDNPGRRLTDVVERWRERAAVVLVARSDVTIGRVWRSIWGCPRIELVALDAGTSRRLVDTAVDDFAVPPLDDPDARRLVSLARGNPRLILTVLRLAARPPDQPAGIEALVRRARLLIIARERDAIVRARRRALADVLGAE